MEKDKFFKEKIYTEAVIDADAEKVWSIIKEFSRYESWNIPLLISGQCVVGARLKIRAFVPGRKPTTFIGRLLACRKLEKLEWFGYVIAPIMLIGVHTFEIVPINDTQVKFINRESFSGLAVPFLREKLLRTKTKDFHNATNQMIKRLSEAQ